MNNFHLKNPQIISSAHGSLDRVLIVFPNSNKYPIKELLRNLIRELPTYTKFLILVENENKTIKSLEAILLEEKIDFFINQSDLNQSNLYNDKKCCVMISPPGHDYSIWVQDPFLVLKDEKSYDSTFLIEPYGENKDMDYDHEIADFLAEHRRFESFNISLIFHGGNVLVGDDFFLLGSSHYLGTKAILEDQNKYPENSVSDKDSRVRTAFSEIFGNDKKMVVVGPETDTDICSVQPMYHIDTFVSLAGRDELGKYIVIVGNPVATDKTLEHLVKPLSEQINLIAKSLIDKGFTVLRNPIPFVRKHINKGPYYPCLYNNVIIEITENCKRIWMPTFAHNEWKTILAEYEKTTIQLWENLGFEVIQLIDFHPFVEHRGAVNCIVKQLDRGSILQKKMK